MVLPKGTSVDITQTLGGTYTIHTQGGLFRIASKDAEALGLEQATPAESRTINHQPVEADEKQVWETLKTCFDPEIPVNIVDLGLVYTMDIEKLPSGFSRVNVKMTLTAPGCGMGPVLASDVKSKVESLPGVKQAEVEVVFDPQWDRSMMSEAARLQLGMY